MDSANQPPVTPRLPEPIDMDGAARSVRMVAYGKKLYETFGIVVMPNRKDSGRPAWEETGIDVQARYCFIAAILVDQVEADFIAGRIQKIADILRGGAGGGNLEQRALMELEFIEGRTAV